MEFGVWVKNSNSEIVRSAIVLAAVQQRGCALQHTSAELRSDHAIVLVAVQRRGRALRYASDKSRGDACVRL